MENAKRNEDAEQKKIDAKPKFRDLTKKEQRSWFVFYMKHHGKLNRMAKDSAMPCNDRNLLAHCRDKYDWHGKYQQKVAEEQEAWRKKIVDSLGEKKLRAIERFYELLEDREVEKVDSDGNIIKVKVKPTYKELDTAIKVIKTELGEPSTIHKNHNLNADAKTEEAQEQLYELLSQANRDSIQGERETPSDSPEVPGAISDDSDTGVSEG